MPRLHQVTREFANVPDAFEHAVQGPDNHGMAFQPASPVESLYM